MERVKKYKGQVINRQLLENGKYMYYALKPSDNSLISSEALSAVECMIDFDLGK